jgi:hypothetical protein
MRYSDGFLGKDAEETEELVVRIARRDRAPEGAQARALSRIAAVPIGVGVALASKTAWAGSTTSAAWLASKWAAVGLGAAVCALGVVQHFEPKVAPPATGVEWSGPKPRLAPEQGSSAPEPTAPNEPEPVGPAEPVELGRAATAAAPSVDARVPAAKRPRDASSDVQGRRPSRREFTTAPAAELTREVAVLKRARVALAAGQARQALLVLDGYHADFPAGLLKTEEAALRVETTFALGDRDRALRLADAFLVAHPTSPLGRRVQTLVDAARASEQKP